MRRLLLALVPLTLSSPAIAAQRSYTVTDFDRIRIDGGFTVVLTTGVAPFGKAVGPADSLDSLSLDVEDRTLIIRPNADWGSNRSGGPVSITVGTHDLRSVWINGSGNLKVDHVAGPSLIVAVQGTGGATIAGIAVDSLKVSMAGSGTLALAGKALSATTSLLGSSALDASALTVRDAIVSANGAALVSLNATQTAKVAASGPATIDLSGSPACTVHADGSAQVSGCGRTDAP